MLSTCQEEWNRSSTARHEVCKLFKLVQGQMRVPERYEVDPVVLSRVEL
jgi:hypothetical protein